MTNSMQPDIQFTADILQLSTDKRNVHSFGMITEMSPIGSRFMLVMQPWQVLYIYRHSMQPQTQVNNMFSHLSST